MNYHETIIDLIYYTLSQGEKYLSMIDKRNAYDKLIRNYHQVNYKGMVVYRNKRARNYYRFSEAAWKKRKQNKLYYEHLIPVKLMKEKLKELILINSVTKENIKAILNENEIVVLIREEASKIDKKHKTTLPNSGKDRLMEYGIIIEPKTEKNSIFR